MGKRTKLGHNSLSADVLKSVLDRVDHLDDQRQGIVDDINDVWAEAKGNGLDVKILKKLRKIRNTDKSKLEEENALLTLYGAAIDIDPFS